MPSDKMGPGLYLFPISLLKRHECTYLTVSSAPFEYLSLLLREVVPHQFSWWHHGSVGC